MADKGRQFLTKKGLRSTRWRRFESRSRKGSDPIIPVWSQQKLSRLRFDDNCSLQARRLWIPITIRQKINPERIPSKSGSGMDTISKS